MREQTCNNCKYGHLYDDETKALCAKCIDYRNWVGKTYMQEGEVKED